MKRVAILAYGLFSYAAFLAVFLYAVGFIGNFIVPKSIDSVPTAPLGTAVFINLLLLGVFAVQHSLMARPFFKRAWTRIVPPAAERSTYVLFSCLALGLVFALWEPIGGVIWHFDSFAGQALMYTIFACGWALVFVSTLAIDHLDLFGVRQVWCYALGREHEPLIFVQPWLYRVVRHPLYVGWLLVMWATPIMTIAHLVFAMACTAYILIAIQWEERDLQVAHREYSEYKKQVPMLIPSLQNLFAGLFRKPSSTRA